MGALDQAFLDLLPDLCAVFTDTPVTITRTTKPSVADGTYDPKTGLKMPATTTTYSVIASPPYTNTVGDLKGGVAKSFKIIVPKRDLAITPSTVTDTLTRNGVVYSIANVLPIDTGDGLCGWILVCTTGGA